MRTNGLSFIFSFTASKKTNLKDLEFPLVFLGKRKIIDRRCSQDFGFVQHHMCTVLLAMRVQVSLNHLEPMLCNGVNNKSLTGVYKIII